MAVSSISDYENIGKRARRQRQLAKTGGPDRPCVYAVQHGDTDRFKIGSAIKFANRLAEMQVATPDPLYLGGLIYCSSRAGAMSLEHRLHRSLREKGRHIVREWFRLQRVEVYDLFSAMCGVDGVLNVQIGQPPDGLERSEAAEEFKKQEFRKSHYRATLS